MHGANILSLFGYNRSFGIHIKGNYRSNNDDHFYENNITLFLWKVFLNMKIIPEVDRVN